MKIVISGGPGSGKTTLIQALASRGYRTVQEAAIQVIEDLNGRYGVEGQKAWRKENRSEFQVMIAEKQSELEGLVREHSAEMAFLDRGRLDSIAYCRFHGNEVHPAVGSIADGHNYDGVVVLRTLSTFSSRRATGRMSSYEDSIQIGDHIEQVYREAGYPILTIPELSVADRLERVLEFAKNLAS